MILDELAKLQVDERHREMDRASLARLARRNRAHAPKLSMLERVNRARRRVDARAA